MGLLEGLLNSPTLWHLLGRLVLLSVGLFVAWFLARSIYYIWFHPLSRYPGPWWAATTNLVHYGFHADGNGLRWVAGLHDRYGEVVRLGPERLSFIHPQAWKDIYGHKTGGRKNTRKDPWIYGELQPDEEHSLISTPDDGDHARLRKIFSPAFSERALRDQQGLLLGYVDKLVARMREQAAGGGGGGGKVDVVQLYDFTTFDIMGDLAFGESLEMLESGRYEAWVSNVLGAVRAVVLASGILLRYRWLALLLARVARPAAISRELELHFGFVRDKVDRRLARGRDQPDVWNLILNRPKGEGEAGDGNGKEEFLSRNAMYSNAALFMVAGSETTSTLLGGLTYNLLLNPDKLATLVAEIRAAFPSERDITLDSLQKLPYLAACCEEGMRVYPPAPLGLPRVVPEGGMPICGDFIPGGTRVYIPQWVAYQSEKNFKDPNKFVPERWLPNSGYEDDRRDVLQPFGMGPRMCLGTNLAYHEMRLIMSKVLWNFDMSLCPESENWLEGQKVWGLWHKPPLIVKLKPVDRSSYATA